MKTIVSAVAGVFLAAALALPVRGATDYRIAGYLWSPGLETTTGEAGEMIEKLGYPSALIAPAIKQALGNFIRNPQLRGVALNRPLAVIAVIDRNDPEPEPLFAVSITLAEPRAFNRALARYFSNRVTEGPDGVRVFAQEIRSFNREAFRRAPDEERKDLSRFYVTRTEMLALATRDGTALLAESPAAVRALLASDPAELRPPIRKNLTAVLNVRELDPALIEGVDRRSRAFGLPPPRAAGETAVRQLTEYWLRQIKTLAFGLTADGAGLRLKYSLEAEPGSPLGEFLEIQRPGALSLARYLDPAAGVVVNSRLDLTPEWNRRITGLIRRLADSFPDGLPGYPAIGGDDLELLAYPEETSEVETAVSLRADGEDRFSILSVARLTPPAPSAAFESDRFPVESVHRGTEIRVYRPESAEEVAPGKDAGPPPDSLRIAAAGGLLVSEVQRGEIESGITAAIDRILDQENLFDLERLAPCRSEASYVYYYSPAAMTAAARGARVPAQTRQFLRRLEGADISLSGCGRVQNRRLDYDLFLSIEKIKILIEIFDQP